MWELIFLVIIILAVFAVTVWVLVDCYQRGSNCAPVCAAPNGASAPRSRGGDDGLGHAQSQGHPQGLSQGLSQGLHNQASQSLHFTPQMQDCTIQSTEAKQFKLVNHQTGTLTLHIESDGPNFTTSVVVGQVEVFFLQLPQGEHGVECDFEVTESDAVVVAVRNSSREPLTLINCSITAQ